MLKKGFVLLLAVLTVCALALTGCGMETKPTLPKLDLDGSELSGKVEYVNGRTCLLRVTEEDSHYDVDDLVYLTYSTITGGKAVSVGTEVRFSYHYTTDVAEFNGEPHITVNEVAIKE